jgi:Bacteriophage HK97-gp10, putative tail-component
MSRKWKTRFQPVVYVSVAMLQIVLDNWPSTSPFAQFSFTSTILEFYAEAAPRLQTELQDAAPVGKGPTAGRLRDSIYYVVDQEQSEVTGGSTYTLAFRTDAPEAKYVLGGTEAHPITPTSALALHWTNYDTGEEVFAAHVNHPGSTADDFATVTGAGAVDWLQSLLEAHLVEDISQGFGS